LTSILDTAKTRTASRVKHREPSACRAGTERLARAAGRLGEGEPGHTLSAAAVNRPLAVLRHLLRVAHEEWEVLPDVPRIRLEKEPQGRLRWLTQEEITKLLDACSKSKNRELRPAVIIAVNTMPAKAYERWLEITAVNELLNFDDFYRWELKSRPRLDDGVERGAQLVRHVGQELRLVLAGDLELPTLVRQLAKEATPPLRHSRGDELRRGRGALDRLRLPHGLLRTRTGGRQKGTPNHPKSIKVAMREFTDENGGELLEWARGSWIGASWRR
jgi:hypothetical protein